MDLSLVQSLWYLLFLAIPLCILVVQSHTRKPISTGLHPHPLLGNLPEYLRHRHRFLEWVTETLVANPTHTMGFHIPCLASGVITANPANVEHILKARFENYPRGRRNTATVEDFLGQGIFNSDGEPWRHQRKTASFEFNKRSLRNFVVDTVREEVVGRLLPLLEAVAVSGKALDLQGVLERFAFDNICNVAFGVDPGSLGGGGAFAEEKVPAGFMKAFDDAAAITFDRFMYPVPFAWQLKRLLNVGTERRLRECISTVHGFAMDIVRSRKLADPSCRKDDLLSRFASSGDHTEEFLRDVVVNFLTAGRETTSSALTWFFWILSSRPDVERKILEEVRSIRAARTADAPETGATFGFEELREMHYLHAAISESLRLYPPVVLDGQECLEDDVLPDGTSVRGGWFTMYSAYAMGRVADIWGEDCGEYRPERWLAEGLFQPASPFLFPVFHGGPRMCLGKEMAYIQMKSVVACVVERFAVEVVEGAKPREHLLSLTLRMKDGLPIRVRKRGELLRA